MTTKQIILPILAFCLTRSIFWFGGIDIMARNFDNGFAMFLSLCAGLAVAAFAYLEGKH